MQFGLEGCVAQECGEQAEQQGAVSQHELEVRVMDRQSVKACELTRSKDSNDRRDVDGSDDQQDGRDDETHGQTRSCGVLVVPDSGCEDDYLPGNDVITEASYAFDAKPVGVLRGGSISA